MQLICETGNSDGTSTDITGTSGVITSPNYKNSYPSSFSHTWRITVSDNATIELEVVDLSTEDNRDIITVSEKFLFIVLSGISMRGSSVSLILCY